MSHWPMTDEQREGVIASLTALAQGSSESAVRRYWFDLMKAEIAARSPEQVAKMEREKGLAA